MNSTTIVYYIETNLICMIILGFILYMDFRETRGRVASKYFRSMIVTIFIYCLSDIVAVSLKWVIVPGSRSLLYFANDLYIALPLLMVLLWGKYLFLHRQAACISDKRINFVNHVLEIVLLGLFLASMSSPVTRFSFYLDSENVYHRTAGAYIVVAACYLYLIYETVIQLVIAGKIDQPRAKRDAKIHALFIIPCVLFSCMQVVFYGITVSQVGFMLGILIVYLARQQNRISKDELTGLDNRQECENALNAMARNGGKLMIAMVDIDMFKEINDSFGHAEGDNAIQSVARILETICTDNHNIMNAVAYRYGGDEFLILSKDYDPECVRDNMKGAISRALDEWNSTSDKPYRLNLSVGVACSEDVKMETVKNLIASADQNMYHQKHEHHRLYCKINK